MLIRDASCGPRFVLSSAIVCLLRAPITVEIPEGSIRVVTRSGRQPLDQFLDGIAREDRRRYAVEMDRPFGAETCVDPVLGVEIAPGAHRAFEAGHFGEIAIAARYILERGAHRPLDGR